MRNYIGSGGVALAILLLGCFEAPSQQVTTTPVAGSDRSASKDSTGLNPAVIDSFCRSLDASWLSELFVVDAELIRRRSSFPVRGVNRVLCTAEWDVPNRGELEESYREARNRWSEGGGSAETRPSAPRLIHRVSVTLWAREASREAAVAVLEKRVETLSTGVALEADGQEVFAQVSYGRWVEVGDRAVFRRDGSLQVAAGGDLMTFGALVSSVAKERHEVTVEVARRFLADRAERAP